jgi:hypothetical protein
MYMADIVAAAKCSQGGVHGILRAALNFPAEVVSAFMSIESDWHTPIPTPLPTFRGEAQGGLNSYPQRDANTPDRRTNGQPAVVVQPFIGHVATAIPGALMRDLNRSRVKQQESWSHAGKLENRVTRLCVVADCRHFCICRAARMLGEMLVLRHGRFDKRRNMSAKDRRCRAAPQIDCGKQKTVLESALCRDKWVAKSRSARRIWMDEKIMAHQGARGGLTTSTCELRLQKRFANFAFMSSK